MKYIKRFWLLFIMVIGITIIFTYSCKKDEPKTINKNITGQVQKGPFIVGTTISMFELKSTLDQTGKIFISQISSNSGTFEISNASLSSNYVELSASGYYFDEVKGEVSAAPLTLTALADVTSVSTINVNILTHLEKLRVEYLVSHGKTFAEAKKIAQEEILAIFGFRLSEMDNSETLDISVNSEGSAILLAISVILQGDRSVGDLSELLANITNNIRESGVLNSEIIKSKLRISTKELTLPAIRSKLEKRYMDLGVDASIPGFEKYVNDFLVFTSLQPEILSQSATGVTTTGATLNGVVNPNSLSTSITFEYGTSISYGNSAPATQSPIEGFSPLSVSIGITGLQPATIYHFRLKSENTKGITYTNDLTFTTLGQAPIAITQAATGITTVSAQLNGAVNANQLSTTVSFEYGADTNYGNTVTASPNQVNGATSTNVSASINELVAGTTYHSRVKAENALGTTYGSDITFTTSVAITDVDGNIYSIIAIGTQVWMGENLKTTKYRDGTQIPNIISNESWISATTGAYCWYNNDISNKNTYGALYNYYSVQDNHKICPFGWHIPTLGELETLKSYLGGYSGVGGKLKEIGDLHWFLPNTGATNETGFTGLPNGYREIIVGNYVYNRYRGLWWSSTQDDDNYAWALMLVYDDDVFQISFTSKAEGAAVRCLKDL